MESGANMDPGPADESDSRDHSYLDVDDDIDPDRLSGSWYGKTRKPNWASHEIRALINGYDRNRMLLRSRGVYKGTGERVMNNAKRQKVWEAITKDVNNSRPDIDVTMGASSYTNCVRTVKEVVKKWVNLVNRMKTAIAIKRSNPRYELSATARAVYNIIIKDEPLLMRERPWTAEQLMVKEECTDFYGEDSMTGAEDSNADYSQASYTPGENKLSSDAIRRLVTDAVNNVDNTPKHSTPFVPTKKKDGGTKRRHKSWDEDQEDESRTNSAKRQTSLQENGYDASFHRQYRVHSAEFDSIDANELASEEADENLKATYKLNKEIMELQRRKLEVEVERMLVEKEKAEIEVEQLLIEKEMALLKKEKLQMEVDQMRLTLETNDDN